jgi:hypothetical protein
MLTIKLDEQERIATLEPNGPLSASDFESASAIIDPFIGKTGNLKGLIIHTETFPGWDSFQAMLSHLTFVKEHHRKVPRVALVTDSAISNIGETIANHFVSADIRSFPYPDMDAARTWLLGR